MAYRRNKGTVAEQLFFLLFCGVTGEAGELTWSSPASLCLKAAERLHGFRAGAEFTRAQALAIINTAADLAASAGI